MRQLVLSRAGVMAGAGVAAGVAGSLWTLRFLAALLYGVEPFEPTIVMFAVVTLSVVGLLAGGSRRPESHESNRRTCLAIGRERLPDAATVL